MSNTSNNTAELKDFYNQKAPLRKSVNDHINLWANNSALTFIQSKMEHLEQIFNECWDNLSLSNKISLHNTYVVECVGDGTNEIFSNDEEFFNTWFNDRVIEAVRATQYSKHYDYMDDYVWYNAHGNLSSGTDENDLPLTDTSEMWEWFKDNLDEIAWVEEFTPFVTACNNEDNEEE